MWRPSHIARVIVAAVAGAAAGIMVGGLKRTHADLPGWFEFDPLQPITWAALGAIAAGGAAFAIRALVNTADLR